MHGPAWLLLGSWASAWSAAMLRACLQGGLCVLGAWAVCRCRPQMPASGRAWLWWLVCLKFTAGLLCLTPLSLPVLPQAPPSATPPSAPLVPDAQGTGERSAAMSGRPAGATLPLPPPGSETGGPDVTCSPLTVLWLLWLMGVTLRLGVSARQVFVLRRRLGRLPGGPAPRVVETDAVRGPLVMGLFRPVILLPRTGLSPEERAMALAHEAAHLRRGDLWVGLLPALTQASFFFFPPARWAVREYHLAREEACDAAAILETGASPAGYARLLLRFTAPGDPSPALGLGADFVALRRRLATLPRRATVFSPRTRRLAALGLALALPGVLPWQLTAARSAEPGGPLPDPGTLRFTLTDLGAVSGDDTEATGLNDRGQVVGDLESSPRSVFGRAFMWEHGQARDLPALPGDVDCRANGINDRGQVIASSYRAYDHNKAFVWAAGRQTTLVGLPGFPHSKALGLSEGGQVAGYVQTGDYDSRREMVAQAALWDAQGRPTGLGTLGGDYSAAYGVNDRGQVVGKADTPVFGSTHAFLWQGGRMTDLGTLGGANSLAVRVNDIGQAVGYSETGDTTHAFVWQGGVMRDLGTLPGGTESEAHAVSDRGQIVGESDGAAALWQDGRVADLNRLVRNAGGWALRDATAVNAHGQIAGQGLAPDGRLHAFLLTPTRGR